MSFIKDVAYLNEMKKEFFHALLFVQTSKQLLELGMNGNGRFEIRYNSKKKFSTTSARDAQEMYNILKAQHCL